MKKYGKKWRKLQREKEIRRANTKVGEPFSKAKNKKHLCLHYGGIPGGIVQGYCFSKLLPISDTECICCECRKTFPLGKYQQMESLVDYLSNKGCMTDGGLIAMLSERIEPVYYRRLSENEIEILETLDNQIFLPRHLCVIMPPQQDENDDGGNNNASVEE